MEQNHYYPFGLKHQVYAASKMDFELVEGMEELARPTYVLKTDYQYKFGAKEWQDELGLGLYDFHARNYDPTTGRTNTMDPLAENFAHQSPYSFFNNNPIYFIDPTGMAGEDFVKGRDGSIYWDKNANDQASTKAGDTYLGKELTFTFNSYIDAESWDGPGANLPGGDLPAGDKLTTTVTLSASENDAGELTDVSATQSVTIGDTPVGTARDYYPGEGGSNNTFSLHKFSEGGKLSSFTVSFEQHANVNRVEEAGLNLAGYNIVDVAQRMTLGYSANVGQLKVNSATNIFPSATLKVNGNQIMKYNQPSFEKTHKAGFGNTSYYPSKFYKR